MENVHVGICTSKHVRALALGAFLILCWAAVSLHAQLGAGTILGVVTDQTGAVVAGATITITNDATGVTRTVQSGAQGEYQAPELAAGTYTIEASAPGFGQTKVSGVVIIVATDTRTDLTLRAGQVTQTVEVSSAVAQPVETTSSSVGTVVNEQRIADLPLNGRNWTDLTLMQPGISQVEIPALTGNAVLAGFNGTIFISNGATDRSNNYLLDGAILQNFAGLNNSSISSTSLGVDGIQEYKVLTNTPSAEYGMRMGSQTVLVSKGGTNKFHGDAYDYLRNSALDARNYFDSLDTANSNGFGTSKSLPYPGKRIPPYRRNNFGGSFGGPVQKDKTFFEASFEGIQQQQAGNAGLPISLTTIPKACFADQSGTLQARVPAQIENVNAYGTCVSGTVNGGAVPATITVAPLMLPFADLYPQPNVTGYSFNYTYPYLQPTTERWGQGRVDHTFSSADSAFVRFTQDDSDSVASVSFPGFVTDRHSDSQFITASEVHIFSSSILNSAQFSVSKTYGSTLPTDVAPVKVTPSLQLVVDTSIGDVVGGITPQTGITTAGTGQTLSGARQNIYSWGDDLFLTKNKHALKFGARFDHYTYGVKLIQGGPGTLSFASLGNFFGVNEGTSLNYSSFSSELPGMAGNGFHYVNNAFGAYAQDDYQIRRRLTLNLGLRYDIATPPKNTVAADACSYRTAQDTTCVPGNMFRNRTGLNFSPRVGFAWDVTGKGTTAVRGGVSVLYDVGSYGFLMYTNVQQTPPLVTYISVANSSVNPATPLTVPLPTTGVSQTPRIVDYNLNQPLLYQYNLAIQQRLPGGWAMTVAYVGSQGRHLYQLREDNPVTPVGQTAAGLPIYGCWNAGHTSTGALTASGACPSGFTTVGTRINSNITTFGQETLFETFGSSWYNAGQLQAVKQLSHGLQMEVFYTFSKLLDDGQGLSANEANAFQYQLPIGYNERTDGDVGPSAFDIKHNFRANLIYHLPNVSSHATGVVGNLINGWWVSSIASANTGIPLTPILASDRELVGNSAVYERPNLDSTFNAKSAVTGKITGWINNSMFDLQPAGQLGNSGRGILRAPGAVNFDFSAVKDTKLGLLGEAGSVEFRAEFFNILNHPNWGFPANAQVWSSGTPTAIAAGQIGSTNTPVGFSNPSAITTTSNNSREIQVALKFIF